MSALPQPRAIAMPPGLASTPLEVRLEPMRADALDAVMQVEQLAYAHPWSLANVADSVSSGYQCEQLLAGQTLLGYYIAMQSPGEVHLLNLTVAPAYQGQGWARVLLDAMRLWARGQGAGWLWLEARVSNAQAMAVYEHYGFRRVGERKNYYPAGGQLREDAVVMSYRL